jgi:hypothetical protein
MVRQLIEIAVDLGGSTQDSRPGIFAIDRRRCRYHSPSRDDGRITWITFSPMTVIPEHRSFTARRSLHLPDSYQQMILHRRVANAPVAPRGFTDAGSYSYRSQQLQICHRF